MADEAVMPYGVTVGGSEGNSWQPRLDGGGSSIALPEGPCRVMGSWAGPEEAALILVKPDERVRLDTIPAQAGGGTLVSDCHRRRCQGRPAAPGNQTAHYNQRDGHSRGLPSANPLTPRAVV